MTTWLQLLQHEHGREGTITINLASGEVLNKTRPYEVLYTDETRDEILDVALDYAMIHLPTLRKKLGQKHTTQVISAVLSDAEYQHSQTLVKGRKRPVWVHKGKGEKLLP